MRRAHALAAALLGSVCVSCAGADPSPPMPPAAPAITITPTTSPARATGPEGTEPGGTGMASSTTPASNVAVTPSGEGGVPSDPPAPVSARDLFALLPHPGGEVLSVLDGGTVVVAFFAASFDDYVAAQRRVLRSEGWTLENDLAGDRRWSFTAAHAGTRVAGGVVSCDLDVTTPTGESVGPCDAVPGAAGRAGVQLSVQAPPS